MKAALPIIGFVIFIWIVMSVLLHLGFAINTGGPDPKPFLEGKPMMLFWINISLGLVGGLLINFKNPIVSGITGLLSATVITGVALVYFNWREHFLLLEIVLPLVPALLLAIFLPRMLNKVFKKKEKPTE